MIPTAEILQALQIGIALVNAATKALNAAHNGDEAAAKAYLAEARANFDIAVAEWDAAPGPTP